MNDERENLPSASSIPRYAACPGSYQLSKGITEVQTKEMAEWAASGDRIHLWLEDPGFMVLDDPQEFEVAELCDQQRTALIEKIFGENAAHVKVIKEDRLWLMQGRKRIFSGKPDDIRIYGDTALIIDFKTGRGDQAESPKNMQLRALAVLLTKWKDTSLTPPLMIGESLRRIHVAIVQPLVNREALITCYELEDLQRAEKELLELLDAINKPDAPLKVNEYCKFCPAKFKCPAIKGAMEILAMHSPPNDGALKNPSGDDLSKLLTLCSMAEPVIKAIKSLAKDRLKENAEAVPGWTLTKPGSIRSISDPFATFKVLFDANLMTRDGFLTDCVSVGIGDLEKAVAKHNKMKPALAKETVNSVCAPFIELKTKEPSLEKL